MREGEGRELSPRARRMEQDGSAAEAGHRRMQAAELSCSSVSRPALPSHSSDTETQPVEREQKANLLCWIPWALPGHYHGIRALRIPPQTNASNKVTHSMQGLKIEN